MTVKLGDGKTYSDLTATEKFIWNGLYTWWIEGALDLIEESYGTNFGFGKKSSADVKEISVTFNEDEFPAATYSTYYLATGKTATLNLNINMDYWDALKKNFGKTVAHEMTHAAMKANVLLEPTYYSLPGFVREGLAELTVGVKNSCADLIKNLTAADFESGLDVNNTGTNESFMYEGGFTFFRYLARQTGNLTIENTKDSSVKTFYGNDSVKNFVSKAKIDTGAGSDVIENYGTKVSMNGGSGTDSLWGGAGNDTFAYTVNQGTDRIYDWESGDMLKIFTADGSRGSFKSSKYSGGDLTLTITGGGKVIFSDVSSSDKFNINGTTYRISGSKLK